MAEEQMEEASTATPFQLQFDKPIPFQIKMAEWNPEKDLLAMVTDDSKILLHRFNWQRLWTISPGKCITSICWSPDGKIIALGTEDGLVLLHDVENGKMLRTIKSHDVAIVCLNWAEDDPLSRTDNDDVLSYEDRTTRFFPPAPVMPRTGGLSSGDTGLADENEEAIQEYSSASCQRFNILCSGGKDGCICFSIFGIFLVGKININKIPIHVQSSGKSSYQFRDASISKVSLSRNLHKLVLLCSGKLIDTDNLSRSNSISVGLHCLHLDSSIFFNRKNELHQVSQQASSIQDLVEVVRASISLMSKQWSSAMNLFHEKFSALPSLIVAHGVESSSEDEFLSLLFGTRTSPALHQFLASSLGEAGLKRIAKAVDGAGREIRGVVSEHLQPAVETISFRLAELRGLARWRSRFQNIGLDEKLIDGVTESIGMLVVQVERFSRVAATVLYLFQNFFTWVLKCVKILLTEPTDQVPAANSELVVIFLKFLLDKDPIKQLLEADERFECDIDTTRHVEELVVFGGFTDTQFLERSLVKQLNELEESLKEAFLMPFTTISSQIHCQGLLPLYPVTSSVTLSSTCVLTSLSFYKDENSQHDESSYSLTDYLCFKIPDGSLNKRNCIGVIKDFCDSCTALSMPSPSGFLLRIPDEYECVDLSLYKDNQVVLLLSERSCCDGPGRSWMLLLQIDNFSFTPLSRTYPANIYSLQELVELDLQLDTDCGKVRSIPHTVSTPLAVSASRGVACVFSSRRHALVYILDEDEDEDGDEVSDME
ncbi:anaphase-promoting complex subunit 4 isoform X2 [Phragmites australis]|uniref:anaphase-promoting complex subunit 4 isoform X2 n=1 Tax=Phragmites australis TaxID=29695 RepID=UPI002D77DA53|nr:anaphase-promoting complex subunit 4 isoform X2 [Phragmites australis]